MNARVYVETTVISYLSAWPSRDLIKAAHQQITLEWWSKRTRFDLYVSQIVLREAGSGTVRTSRTRLHDPRSKRFAEEAGISRSCSVPRKN